MWYIFDYTPFAARGDCGHWDVFHKSLYYWSNFGIFIEYVLIPATALTITYLIYRESLIEKLSQLAMRFSILHLTLAMGAFVVACGLGHLLDGVGAFHWPAYRLFAWWHFITFLTGLWALGYSVRIMVHKLLLLRGTG